MSDEFPEPGEGNSPAAWTAVIIMLVAFSIGTIAFFFDVQFMVWASVGLLLVGIIVGFVMKRMGYGVYGAKYTPKGH
ncbi:hypothetical protein F1C58_08060 [Glaciihabitans sp. INWT7]|uniref:DUF6704 family protein n=1 Tax=Glaciihabitans sp. INWT7 TaxID=2596912 RepID=UPI0016294955|nr:DUF6704 family protein [Glaciihabitans sp. INWT7]QNE46860.1 hypothetical protein F1C58_08060 [Glaciihabitans sp. INWT7]